jgi:TonB-linked SusC/RagA family outer membrane protein
MNNAKPIQEGILAFMKIAFVQIALALVSSALTFAIDTSGQQVLEKRVSIKANNEKIKSVLKKIENQVAVTFTYSADLVKKQKIVTITLDSTRLIDALDQLFDHSLGYEVINDDQIILRPLKDPFLQSSIDQPEGMATIFEFRVTGKVLDENAQPLPGVNVVEKGTTNGTTTDASGNYTLNVHDEKSVLVFSFIGYAAQEVPINNKSIIDVSLAPSVESLQEVVVIGYGTVERKDLTGSVGSVGSEEIKDLAVTRIDQVLSGRVAGVQVKFADGQPGASPQIRIRGIGSISAGVNPLYVIDGFPTDNIQTLNPNDIESLDVLKDASATAIYGSRGSNGVILITTKRGKAGKTAIYFDTYYGLQSVSKVPEFLNVMEQASYHYNAIRNRNINSGNNVSGDPATWAVRVPQTVLDVLSGKNTNNTDALGAILRTATQKNYDLSVSGGNENAKYAVSGSYLDQDGIIINNNFKRYSLRANMDAQLTKRLALRLNVNPSHIIENNVTARGGGAGASTSIIGSATSAQPYYPLYNPDGSYFIYQTIDASTDLFNPVALALEKQDVSTKTGFLGNMNAEYKVMDGLKINILMGATTTNIKGHSFTPQLPVFFNRAATGTDFATSNVNWLAEYTVNYNKNFGKHNINASVGYTSQKDKTESNSLSSSNYPNNLVPYLSAVSGIITTGTASREEWSIVSELARVNYNFGGKYFLTSSIRRDGSSRFGANNKYGVFPSVAAAWRVSDENFMQNVPVIDQLKVRASYGQTGNNNIGNYASLATINYIKYTTGGAATGGFAPGAIPNPDLTWETQQQLNGGLDVGLFKGKLTLTVDYFISRNKGLLLNVNVPTASGFSTALQNIGEVKNNGWELVVSSVNMDGKFKWSTDFNLSSYRNEVVKLGPSGDDIIAGNNITRIGQPIGMFYGFIADGIFKNVAELAAGPIYNKGLADDSRVGDIRFKDVNGPNGVPDGIIDNNDLAIMGSPYPDFYYGMTNRLSYQNLSLSVNISGSQGSSIYSNAMVIYKLTRSRSRTLSTERNYWKSEEDPGDGVTPRPDDNPRGGLRRPSSRYLDDGTYLRINNITLSYLLHTKISQRLMVGSIRFYVSSTNPFIFTKNLSFNPDVSDSGNSLNPGLDTNNYPIPRNIMFGLNLLF